MPRFGGFINHPSGDLVERIGPIRSGSETEHLKGNKMLNYYIKDFANDESGAVTVDWVVLTAAIVGLGLVIMAALREPITTAATNIADTIEGAAGFVEDGNNEAFGGGGGGGGSGTP